MRGVIQPDGGEGLLRVPAALGAAATGCARSGSATLSRTLSHGYSDREKSWNTTASPSGTVPCTAVPFTVIVPRAGGRRPAKNFGIVAGTMSLVSRWPAESRNTRAVSTWSGSTVRAPSIVFTRMGQTVPNAMYATSIWSPSLNSTMKTVTGATAGSDRLNRFHPLMSGPEYPGGPARQGHDLVRAVALNRDSSSPN